MKKTLYLMLLLFVFLGFWVACNEPAPTTSPPSGENDENPPAHTHTFGEWMTVNAATCVSDGQEKRTCVCGESETKALAATGVHIYAENICSLCLQSKDQIRLATMTLKFENEYGKLYFDENDGSVGYWNTVTDHIVFTAPTQEEAALIENHTVEELMSHVLFDYITEEEVTHSVSTYNNTVLEGLKISVDLLPNGIQLNYGMTDSRKFLLPKVIEATAFEEKILNPMRENAGATSREYQRFLSYYNKIDYLGAIESGDTQKADMMAEAYPMVKEKQINVYAYNGVTEKENERIEGYITTYCPNYTFEELERDHAYANYYEMVYTRFYTALMFTVDENGLTVDFAENCVWGEFSTLYELPENGINSHKQVTNVEVLPYLKSLKLEGITILCP